MNWRDFLLGVGIVGAFVALGIGMTKALSSHPKQERRLNCKFIPTGEIVAREYDDAIEVIRGPAYECYIKGELK
ncbi:MAG: hypothetical protein COY46_03795 [Chloroflexi bacterium CG_4_10_14_0_8_um_filter_46_9]|nr:MAG: hypothetical protein COW22_00975 [Chloroflexi bacterium CG15_BIG_FIL_POST_REV_8_21_14_020_46_15]PIZ26704.1 MAG: hypothetical protein COY46_03795 [Chloroflexi bacterium CG_4_10_14_0_8_um_filter_46_9]